MKKNLADKPPLFPMPVLMVKKIANQYNTDRSEHGGFKIPAIVRLYQLRDLLRAKMLGIDTILGTVCIVEKSIYSGGLANVGRWPAFFVPGNRGVALRQRRRKRRQ